jgi:hypothetical protein
MQNLAANSAGDNDVDLAFPAELLETINETIRCGTIAIERVGIDGDVATTRI